MDQVSVTLNDVKKNLALVSEFFSLAHEFSSEEKHDAIPNILRRTEKAMHNLNAAFEELTELIGPDLAPDDGEDFEDDDDIETDEGMLDDEGEE